LNKLLCSTGLPLIAGFHVLIYKNYGVQKARVGEKAQRTRLVREHFKPIRNAALGQKMRIMKPI